MTAFDRLLSGERVRIDYHGRAVDVTFQRNPIDHIRLDDARGGRIQLRYMSRTDLAAWLNRYTTTKGDPAMKKTMNLALIAVLAFAALVAAPAAAAQDALTIYTPTASHEYAGEVLGFEAAKGSNGAVGFVLFDTSDVPPIVTGPRRFSSAWAAGGWTAELSPDQTAIGDCVLWAVAYLAGSGMHVDLRCLSGPV